VSAPAVSIRGLVKRFGDVVAVDGLDLVVESGECFGLLGPNGAGKTTTIEILEGLQPPTAGEVRVLGLDWRRDATTIRSRIGVQLQETILPDKLKVRETLELFRSFYALARPVADVLGDVGLQEKATSRVGKLSGGQKQRLAIGCALVSDPEVLFLDEPTTGLDPAARRALWDVVRAFQSRGRTVVITTHYMEEAERLCDRIAIVDRGRVAATGTPRELIVRVGGEEVVEVSTQPPLSPDAFAGVAGVVRAQADGDGVRLAVEGLARALPAVLARLAERGAVASRLVTRHATLEDVFLQVAGRRFEEAEAASAATSTATAAAGAGSR
jgi:ABC-2 type transport system ATP-binding protein